MSSAALVATLDAPPSGPAAAAPPPPTPTPSATNRAEPILILTCAATRDRSTEKSFKELLWTRKMHLILKREKTEKLKGNSEQRSVGSSLLLVLGVSHG
ncbi:5-hydroxybenzimidazole synthase BzaA [Frankliniella fusca]|uniref:5-hydroxybenzimidazole synthase BzaA n=1 Tax=Frankliniella fusca TaxID=407009 RepID=A0AAE1LTQ6_9NEOP|nr:5-hydroxybenzimidazole synthase BzaA [Frankliniella fusca]